MKVMKILNQLRISRAKNSYQVRENFTTVQHFQDKIKFLREKVGNKNEIIKTFIENISCLKKQLMMLIKKFKTAKSKY